MSIPGQVRVYRDYWSFPAIAVLQSAVYIAHRMWAHKKDLSRMRVPWENSREFADHVVKHLTALFTIDAITVTVDEATSLPDADRKAGVHQMDVMLDMHPTAGRYFLSARSDMPMTQVVLGFAEFDTRWQRDVNIFNVLFTERDT